MPKASSARKVARAAGLGGTRSYTSRPPYGYYLSVAILLILGVVGVYNSREYLDNKTNQAGKTAPKVGQNPPWYEGYAIDECGKVLANITTNKDPYGITTRGDGIIYISPTKLSAAGKNATLGKFASSIGMTFNAGEVQVPGGKLYTDGQSCEGKAGHVYVEVWSSPAEPQADGTVQTTKSSTNTCNPDCDSGVLLKNDQLVTIAFVPSGSNNSPPTNIPQPSKAVIDKLTTLAASSVTSTTAAPATSSTTTTTAKGSSAKTGTTSGVTTTTSATTTTGTAKTTTTAGAKTTTTAAAKKSKKASSS